MSAKSPTVDELMTKAFSPGREPRSAEYKQGVRDLLAMRIEGVRIAIPYTQGTAQRDAYYSGVDEGKAIWRAIQPCMT
ncbi:hypothetical protein PQQ75_25215 [Paraburkholderia aspalathi]|uniref:hypothetical protein n=1 Tax=Paraburkholderia aspalathi TaxID=1324617 RepID=UPI0038BBB1D9